MRRRFSLMLTTCRRCACTLTTGSHSLTGADAAKAGFDRICDRCITNAERLAILSAQAQALRNNALTL